MTIYAERRAAGKCGKCGNEDERTRAGMSICARCAARQKAEYTTVPMSRFCERCGEDITHRRRAKYCVECARIERNRWKRVHPDKEEHRQYVPPKRAGLSIVECARIAREHGVSYGTAQAMGLFKQGGRA